MEYPKATFGEPTPYGYLYAGIRSDPPKRLPRVRRSAKRAERIRACLSVAEELRSRAEVVGVTVHEATVIPPVRDSPRFDVIVLVTTTSPETAKADLVRPLDADLVMPARNVRRIGESGERGTVLFNHFTAADPDLALATWEDITGWFVHEAGVDNSTLLRPTGESPYVFVNQVRLPCGPFRFLLRFAKPSFRRFVAARLAAAGIGNAPVICAPVGR